MSLGMRLRTRIEGKQALRLIKWLQKKHLLKKKLRCPVCHHGMKMISVVKKDQYMWCCKRASHRKVSRTIKTGSLFEKSKTSLFSWMKFIYRFSQGLRLRQIDMIDDEVAGSSRTLSSMARHIRHVCISAIKRHRINNGHRLGGDREFVVIDESCLRHQRKYGCGRFGNAWKRKKWVFGMMGIKDKRRRLVLKLESVRQEAKHAQELQSPFYGSRLAFGGPRSLQTAMATAEPAPMPRAIRLSTCSFSPVATPPPPPLGYQSDKKVKRRRKRDYVTPDVRLTPLQSFALFLGLPRSELHKLSASSSQPGLLEGSQPSLPPPTSRRKRRSRSRHSVSAEPLPVVSYNDCFHFAPSKLEKDNHMNTAKSETVKTITHGGGRKLKNILEDSVFSDPAPSPSCVPAPRVARAQHSPAPVSVLQVREAEVQLVPAPVPVAAPVPSPRVGEAGIRQVPAPVSDLAGGSVTVCFRWRVRGARPAFVCLRWRVRGARPAFCLRWRVRGARPAFCSRWRVRGARPVFCLRWRVRRARPAFIATTCGSHAVTWSSYGFGFVLAWSSYGFGFVLAWSSYGFSSAVVWSSFSVACSVTLARSGLRVFAFVRSGLGYSFAWSCLGHADVRTTSCASTAPASFQASDYTSWSCSSCPACSSCTSCPACSSFLATFQADDWASSPSWTASFRADDWASSPSWTAS
ncbi:unnamed protein product [Oreochromis niloticus]|nr:unnamed protein product [Mustela putorius furo]